MAGYQGEIMVSLKHLAIAAVLYAVVGQSVPALADVPMCPTVRSCAVAYSNCANDRGRTNNQSMQCENYKKACDQTGIWAGIYVTGRIRR